MKKTIIIITAIGLFAFLLAFNVTATINNTTDAKVDVRFNDIKAQSGHCGRCEDHPSVPDIGYCDFTYQVYIGCPYNDGTECEDYYEWECMAKK